MYVIKKKKMYIINTQKEAIKDNKKREEIVAKLGVLTYMNQKGVLKRWG